MLSLSQPLSVQASSPVAPGTFVQEKISLFPYLTYIEDEGAKLSFEQVKNIPASEFSRPAGDHFIAGHSRTAVYWIKVDLTGDKHVVFESNPVLYLPYREFTSLYYYKPLANGDYKKYEIGRHHGVQQKDISSPHIAFSSDQRGWQQKPIYFRLDFREYNAAKTMPAFLYSQQAFANKAQIMAVLAAGSYAFFFTMLLYNLSFFLTIRERFFAYYVIYLASSWIVCMGNDGVWSTWVIRSNNNDATRILDAVTIIGCICAYLAFICEILNIKKNMPWIIWPVMTVYIYAFIAATATLLDINLNHYSIFNKDIVGVYSLCFSLVIFSFSLYKKIPYVRVVAPAWLSLITLGGIYSSYLGGNIGYNEYLPWTMSAGFVAELCVLSMVVAVKIREIIRERETAKVEFIIASRNAAENKKLATEKSRFIAHVGHDMRQPLYLLRLQLSLLKIKITDNELLKTITAMGSSIKSIESMFEDILYMSQLESGSIVPEAKHTSIANLLEGICEEFADEAEKRGIKLVTFCHHYAYAKIDSQIMKRILGNLMQNALRHTENGGVLIGCRRRKNGYRIDVIDTGTGISSENQEKLFKPLQKINSTKILDGNLGLGLSIVATLSELIGATVEVKSTPGKGSRFSIFIPVYPGQSSL